MPILQIETLLFRTNERERYEELELFSVSQLTFQFALAVQEERGPRKSKASVGDSRKCRTVTQKQRFNQLIDGNQQRYRILIQILVCCIDQVRQNRSFQYLDRGQQDYILGVVWFECFLLRAAYWTIDVLPIVDGFNDTLITTEIAKLQELELDLTELYLMETLILCRKELGVTAARVEQLEYIQESSLLSLGHYVLHKGRHWPRYGRLLLGLRSIRETMQSNNSIIYVAFKGIIADLIVKS